MNRFYVGQKVQHVPIFGNWNNFERRFPDQTHPVPNGIYTIREIYLEIDDSGDETVAVKLKEIVNPIREYSTGYKEMGWVAVEFKPLEEKKTDISIFKKMLVGNKVNADSQA